jgi:hypothetical protein
MQKFGEYKFQIWLGLIVLLLAGYGIYGITHLPARGPTFLPLSTATSLQTVFPTASVTSRPTATNSTNLSSATLSLQIARGMLQNAPTESPETLHTIAQIMDQSGLFRISKMVDGSTGSDSESALLNMLSSGTVLRNVSCPAPTVTKEKYTCTVLGVYVLNENNGTAVPTPMPASVSEIWLVLSIDGPGGVHAPVSIDYARSPAPLRGGTIKPLMLDEAGLQNVQRGRPLSVFIPVKTNRWQYACKSAAPLEQCQSLINFAIWYSSGITAEIYRATGGFPQNAVALPPYFQIPAPKTEYEFPISSFALPGGYP